MYFHTFYICCIPALDIVLDLINLILFGGKYI